MRIAIVMFTVPVVAVGLLFSAPNTAHAAYNISGTWSVNFGSGPCPTTITQSYLSPTSNAIKISFSCGPYYPASVTGTINTTDGAFIVSDAYFSMNGALSADNQSMSGIWVSYYPRTVTTILRSGARVATPTRNPRLRLSLPRQATATFTPAPPTPTPPTVAGVAFDAPSTAASRSTRGGWRDRGRSVCGAGRRSAVREKARLMRLTIAAFAIAAIALTVGLLIGGMCSGQTAGTEE